MPIGRWVRNVVRKVAAVAEGNALQCSVPAVPVWDKVKDRAKVRVRDKALAQGRGHARVVNVRRLETEMVRKAMAAATMAETCRTVRHAGVRVEADRVGRMEDVLRGLRWMAKMAARVMVEEKDVRLARR